MPRKRERRSACPVACTLDLIGDKWTLLVVRDLAHGKAHYGEFLASPEGIATNILADRLQRLVENGLVERQASPVSPARDAYYLTRKGESLKPVLGAIKAWGLDNVPGTAVRLKTSGR